MFDLKLRPFVADQILFFGKKGSGKTSFLSSIAYRCHKLGITCYSTEKDIAYTYYLPYDQIGEVWLEPHSVLLIDEIATLFNSRSFKSTKKSVIDYFRYSRHNQVKLIYFSQTYNDLDFQIRQLASSIYVTKKIGKHWSMYRRIDKVLELVTNDQGYGEIVDSYKYAPIIGSQNTLFLHLSKYYKYFDSYSRLDIPDVNNSSLVYTSFVPAEKKPSRARTLWSRSAAFASACFIRFKNLLVKQKKIE